MDRAVPLAINSILADCVRESKKLVPKKTTILQGSIQMRTAVKDSRGWVGFWGSFQVLYALFVELGTAPHKIFPRTAKALFWKGAAHPVASVNHPGTKPRPFLRVVADRFFPMLAARIRQAMAAEK